MIAAMPTAATAVATPPLSAGVLAGGAGLRLGGADKGLLAFRGRPLIDWVLAALRPQSVEQLISANRHPERYAAYGLPVFADRGGQGPLAGLAALLTAARQDWLLCVPCDSPELPAELGARLYAAALAAGAPAAYLHDDLGPHPTFCLVRCALAASAQAAAEQQQGLVAWLDAQGAARLRAPAPVNLNTAADFAAAEARP